MTIVLARAQLAAVAARASNVSTRAFVKPNGIAVKQSQFKLPLRRQQSRRHASSSTTATTGSSRVLNFFYHTTLVAGLGLVYLYLTDTRASIHKWIVIPALRTMYKDPEEAHEVGNKSLKGLWTFGMHPRERGDPDQKGDLAVEVFGQTLRNPIGTSAGIDKHADIPDPLFAIGPSIIEIGGTTPQPQAGNDKPRVFRLSSQNALINRYGLNSEGADSIAQRLRRRVRHFAEACGFGHDVHGETRVLDGEAGVPPGSLLPGRLLAINIAKNKITPENDIEAVTKDYLYCAERLAPYADILVVNVSSPNTPGLRSLQTQESLTKILSSVVRAARSVQRTTKPAVMVKVSPDEDSDDQVAGICQAIWASDVDGVIVGNTTNQRPEPLKHLKPLSSLEEQYLLETGGFSGPHLFKKTLSMVKKYRKVLGDQPAPNTTPSRSPGSLSSVVEETKSRLAESSASNAVTDSIQTESIPLTNIAEKADSEKQSLFKLPTERFYDQSQGEQDKLQSFPQSPEQESGNNTVDQTGEATAEEAGVPKSRLAGSPANNAITDSIQTESIPLRNLSEKPESEKQSLFKLPIDRFYDQSQAEQDKLRSSPGGPEKKQVESFSKDSGKQSSKRLSGSSDKQQAAIPSMTPDKQSARPSVEQSAKNPTKEGASTQVAKDLQRRDQPKVIFATGGITNGKQALEILNAGASVAMVYTALVYGGVGTISRIKDEMRNEITSKQKKKQNKQAALEKAR